MLLLAKAKRGVRRGLTSIEFFVHTSVEDHPWGKGQWSGTDLDFIAHALADVPRLSAEILRPNALLAGNPAVSD